jgi:uncharacterized membrane protein
MKHSRALYALILFALVSTASSCEAIAGIFKAGVWTGIILVVIVIALIIFIIAKVSKK